MGILHVIDDGNPTAKAQTTVAGKTINITATGEQLARGADIDGHVNADTMTQKLVLGDETSDITVAVHATGDKAKAAGMLTLYKGASIEVKGKNLNVEAKSEKGNAIGIGAMIGTTEATQSESKIIINSENAVIRAYGDYSAAIQATSQGQILVNGNLMLTVRHSETQSPTLMRPTTPGGEIRCPQKNETGYFECPRLHNSAETIPEP